MQKGVAAPRTGEALLLGERRELLAVQLAVQLRGRLGVEGELLAQLAQDLRLGGRRVQPPALERLPQQPPATVFMVFFILHSICSIYF